MAQNDIFDVHDISTKLSIFEHFYKKKKEIAKVPIRHVTIESLKHESSICFNERRHSPHDGY